MNDEISDEEGLQEYTNLINIILCLCFSIIMQIKNTFKKFNFFLFTWVKMNKCMYSNIMVTLVHTLF